MIEFKCPYSASCGILILQKCVNRNYLIRLLSCIFLPKMCHIHTPKSLYTTLTFSIKLLYIEILLEFTVQKLFSVFFRSCFGCCISVKTSRKPSTRHDCITSFCPWSSTTSQVSSRNISRALKPKATISSRLTRSPWFRVSTGRKIWPLRPTVISASGVLLRESDPSIDWLIDWFVCLTWPQIFPRLKMRTKCIDCLIGLSLSVSCLYLYAAPHFLKCVSKWCWRLFFAVFFYNHIILILNLWLLHSLLVWSAVWCFCHHWGCWAMWFVVFSLSHL